jgi:methyl-accepting chemotaxis protein
MLQVARLMTHKVDLHDALFRQMVELMPVNVMICELQDFRITYVNESTRNTLRKIEHVLPVKVDALVGSSIDVFHKNPSHQRRLLSDPKNLPHKARISIGGEVLDLLVTALTDRNGKYIAPMLTWSLVTEQVKGENNTARLLQMLDNMPINVMLCDLDFNVAYVNKTSLNTLRPLQSLLPVPVDKILGSSIDVFHKVPSHQRRILADPKNLPHRAKIKLGGETLDLRVSALLDPDGKYMGPMLTWNLVTGAVKLSDDVKMLVNIMASSSTEMQATAQTLAAGAEQASQQSSAVATASEQLTSSVTEISRQISEATNVVQVAVTEAQASEKLVANLTEAAAKIGNVSEVVAQIAGQTNLLALNATIEAARAGDAGKGFAVVASEVKSLANQTAKATDEISQQVKGIQESSQSTARAIREIVDVISRVSEISASISSAVEEQSAATQEVTRNISGVKQATEDTGRSSANVLAVSEDLAKRATELEDQITDFVNNL